MNKIDALYEVIIDKLKKDLRPLVKIENSEVDEVLKVWERSISSNDHHALKKILCILDNTQTFHESFEKFLLMNLEKLNDSEILVYSLSASLKHILERRFRNGDRVDMQFLNILKKLLHHSSPEVKEWTLRVIEQIGPQSIMLKEDILKVKPSLSALFNKHQKAAKQIIELIEKRWII